jgi:3-oxoadipate enol-lactonase
MPYATNTGVPIHWQERGEGTPLLLIMGRCFSGEMWWPALPAVTLRHHVVWFDNRGTGESDSPATASVSEMVGGGIAQQLALTAPHRVTSLILGCTAFKTEVTKAPKARETILLRLPKSLYRPLAAKALYGTKAPAEAVAKDIAMLKKDKFTPRGVAAQSAGVAEFTMTLADAGRINVPTLVQHGTADPVVPSSPASRSRKPSAAPGCR